MTLIFCYRRGQGLLFLLLLFFLPFLWSPILLLLAARCQHFFFFYNFRLQALLLSEQRQIFFSHPDLTGASSLITACPQGTFMHTSQMQDTSNYQRYFLITQEFQEHLGPAAVDFPKCSVTPQAAAVLSVQEVESELRNDTLNHSS